MSETIKIEIFGSGCAKCKKMEENVQSALKDLEISSDRVEIRRIDDVDTISERGVLLTPALGINGEIVIEGNVATVDLIKGHLKTK